MIKVVKEELIEFIKRLKEDANVSMDKHLFDHLLWIVREYYNEKIRLIDLLNNEKRKRS